MPRVIIAIQSDTEDNEFISLESNAVQARKLRRLTCDPAQAPFSNVANGNLTPAQVRAAGAKLATELRQHPAVATALAEAAGNPGTPTPMYLHIQSERAEDLPWEALYDGNGFLALDRLRPIGRVTDSERDSAPPKRSLAEPIRMFAVLSAVGVDAQPEWEAIKGAVQKLQSAGVHIELQIYVGEPALKQRIQQDAVANVTLNMLQDGPSLLAAIVAASPHILHFFCHGSSQFGPHLAIATNADHLAATGVSSILLEPRNFDPPDIRKSLWLATLNACQSAAAGPQTRSLARGLVNIGIPVVIAMRELIAPQIAHAVTATTYDALFAELEVHLKAPPNDSTEEVEIEWASVLAAARGKLLNDFTPQNVPSSHAAEELKEWTLPVLYIRSPEFRLVRNVSKLDPRQEAEYQAELSVLSSTLAGLHPSTPDSVRQPILARIDQLKTLLAER